jgi:hypothetical protein
MTRALILFILAAPLFAQQKPTTTQNPLDKLHDQAKAVFERAGVPFSEEQERSVALMIEDRRQAFVLLCGDPFLAAQRRRMLDCGKWKSSFPISPLIWADRKIRFTSCTSA